MGRRKTHAPLCVYLNNNIVGRLEKEPSGAIFFDYDKSWLERDRPLAISRSLPLISKTYRGEIVSAVFENLLPDSERVRGRVAERTGAAGIDAYSLLETIGRDCVGALQFLPEGCRIESNHEIKGEIISETEIEKLISSLSYAPLGISDDDAFRISVAGAQDKTALLYHNGKWLKPIGTTPTTHIFKPQMGNIQTFTGAIDMSNSVDNEHYCLALLRAFGLKTANTEIITFGAHRILVVERFDRYHLSQNQIIRLPQEDCCQALGVPPTRKYQSTVEGRKNGPSAVDILKLLSEGDNPNQDRIDFLKSQIIFWLIGATDGHAKNFSIFLKPGGGFSLTPFYDVLSVQSAFDLGQIPNNKFKLAMSVGRNRKYTIMRINGRHFVETAKEGGSGITQIRQAFEEVMDLIPRAADIAITKMPMDFDAAIHKSIAKAIQERSVSLGEAFGEL